MLLYCCFDSYNEKIMDLLDPSLGPLKVREHKTFGVFVDKISKAYVKSVEQAVEVMDRGLLNRTVQATKMNSGILLLLLSQPRSLLLIVSATLDHTLNHAN